MLPRWRPDGQVLGVERCRWGDREPSVLLEEARRSHTAMLTMQIAAAADSVEAAERRAELADQARQNTWSAINRYAHLLEAELAGADGRRAGSGTRHRHRASVGGRSAPHEVRD